MAVFRGTKDSSHAGKDAINQGFSGAGKNLNLKSSEVEQILRRMITMDVIEEQLEIHQGRATISRLAVNERKVAELTAGGQRPLRVEITALGEAGPARSTSPARVSNAAGPSAVAAAVGAPAEKKAARKKKPKAVPAALTTTTTTAAAPLPQVINLVSDDDDDDENDDDADLSRNPEVKLRFDIMCAMLRQLSVVLKEHTAGRRIPLSTSVQQKIAKNPPKTLEDINKMTISGFNTHMKKRFGPALLAGVVQADSHLLAVKAEMATVEDFILDKVTALAKLAHVNASGAPVVAGQQQQQQQHQNYYYPQPPKTTTHANGNAGTANKRPRDEDLDWGDDSDDDDDDWGGITAVNVQPQAAALAPYQQQQQQQRQQQVQQPHQPQQQQKFNYLAQNPPPHFPTEDNSPTTIAAFRPPNYTNNTIKNATNPINDGVPLVQRQKLLKAKLQQDVASAAGPKAPPPYNAHPGQVKSMAVKDINNAFG